MTATLGDSAGSNGTLNVIAVPFNLSFLGSNFRSLIVGNNGNGTLNVSNDADVSLTGASGLRAVLGYNSGSSGTATVSGAGSTWTTGGELYVGDSGAGTLSILSGGSVTNPNTRVGSSPGSAGAVTISGAGSTWTNSQSLILGYAGTSTLTMADGARISNGTGNPFSGQAIMGHQAGSISTASVSGAGTTWTNDNELIVGSLGTAMLTIESGAHIASAFGRIGIGDSASGTAIVTGPDSRWTNNGILLVGQFGSGALSIQNGGNVTSGSGALGRDSDDASGTVVLEGNGSTWTISDGLAIAGEPGDGIFIFPTPGGTGMLTINKGTAVSVGHDIDLFPGGKVQLYGGTLDVGTVRFHGAEQFQQFHWVGGTLHVDNYIGTLFNDGGTLAPGHSIGRTTIGGSYVQFPNAELEIEIGMPADGLSSDVVDIAFNAALNGELKLDLIDGFTPTAQQTFTILKAGLQVGSLSGAFSNVANGQRLTTMDGLGSFLVHYGTGSAFDQNQVVLTSFLSTPLSGDYNQNGVVDAADYVLWRDNLGSGTSLANDDTAGVGPDDYDRWKVNFGQIAGAGSALVNVRVPEPTTFAMLMLAAGSWWLWPYRITY